MAGRDVRWAVLMLIGVGLAGSSFGEAGRVRAADSARQAGPATQAVGEADPLGVMERLYRPLCERDVDLGWPMKVRSMVSGGAEGAGGGGGGGSGREGGGEQARRELKFSTSTRELFFAWATRACADWKRDTALDGGGAYVQCHGDVHFGNVGVYTTDVRSGRVALGLVDFDETVAMPFQIDLLQAMVTLRLEAARRKLTLDDATAARAAGWLLGAYRTALDTGRTATELIGTDPRLSRSLEADGGKTPRDEVEKYVEGGRFRRVVRGKDGAVKGILRPVLPDPLVGDAPDGLAGAKREDALYDKATLASAITRAMEVSPSFKRAVAYRTTAQWETAIEDAALRTRVGSGGSQGMRKVLIYVRSAVRLGEGTSDALIYFKEAASSAAQRGGYASLESAPESGGRRVTGGMSAMLAPEADARAWCDVVDKGGTHSFVVDIRTPWEDEPEIKVNDAESLEFAANYLGTCIGAAHCQAAGGVKPARRLRKRATEALERQLVTRSAEYVRVNRAALQQTDADARTAELLARAAAAIAAHTGG